VRSNLELQTAWTDAVFFRDTVDGKPIRKLIILISFFFLSLLRVFFKYPVEKDIHTFEFKFRFENFLALKIDS